MELICSREEKRNQRLLAVGLAKISRQMLFLNANIFAVVGMTLQAKKSIFSTAEI